MSEPSNAPISRPPCPRSAVSHGVGLSGLFGLLVWTAIAAHYHMDGPLAGMMAVILCGIPMVVWSLLVDKVHRRPSTGIDWSRPQRSAREAMDFSIVKLAGLWTTWGAIAVFYATAQWYAVGPYIFTMTLFKYAAPVLLLLSIPYVIWLDRYFIDPRDGAYALGQWVIGGGAGKPAPGEIANHLRSWAVKGFFLAFMISIVPGNFATAIQWNPATIFAGPANLAHYLIALLFMVDVTMATVGYMLTCKPLDAHIRTANPLLTGWIAALMCYPPFVMMGIGGPLDYHQGTAEWTQWLAGNELLLGIWAGILVLLTGIYAWATVVFGLRFSNLTHRGIITHGPYRWTRHPAYVAKNLFWWFSIMPFLTTTGSWLDAVRNCALLALTNAVYYWRAKTEEEHLGTDPDYAAYSDWMEHHGPLPRLVRRLLPLK